MYDTYLQPNGAFYAVRKACNPIHAIYRYGFNDIYLANEDLQDAEKSDCSNQDFRYLIRRRFLWINGQADIKTNLSKIIYKLTEIKNLTSVYFLDLRIFDANNLEIDNSIYWLSTKPDVLDYEAAKALEWPFYTPTKEYADFTALDKLPESSVGVRLSF
ncbi:MAG: hypothetical protein U5K79_08360 [Cyclobacteriaceae bacterium]|nr:hypothetical protein [Cyclobacteriaceae bacterium]